MKFTSDIRMYTRFACGLPSYFRRGIALEEARQIVTRRLAQREETFLRVAERGIYGYERSPYRRLLQMAGCELADLRRMVRSHGLNATLRKLRDAGVAISFEEFKGRQPIVRNGRTLQVEAKDFDNPWVSRYYYAETGGSTGAGTRVPMDLEHLVATAPYYAISYDAHGVWGAPTALWRGILPDSTGIDNILRASLLGQTPQRWFTPVTRQDLRPSLKNRLATWTILTAGRLSGVPMPLPEPVSLDRADVVARWAAQALRRHGRCMVRTNISKAVRVCLAAEAAGLNLTGCTFFGGGEPPTPSKLQHITRVGAKNVPTYAMTETGFVGVGCARPQDENDCHLLEDAVALIQYTQQVPGTDIEVPAFCLTTLLPTSPRIMLNVEIDDYGVCEERSCGCPLEQYGFRKHVTEIRSYRKLTGEGVTLIGSDMIRILEEVLPAKFGGTALDYQFMEEENERGFTQLSLVISPQVAILDENAVIGVVLEAMGRENNAAGLARAEWAQAGTLRVKRMEPVITARGKLMPLHLAQRGTRKREASVGAAGHP
jgi:hypothetical protein